MSNVESLRSSAVSTALPQDVGSVRRTALGVHRAPGSAFVGLSGLRRDAAAAVCVGGELVSACAQERLTRTRRAGLEGGGGSDEMLGAVLSMAGRRASDVSAYVTSEDACAASLEGRAIRLSHHQAHAATAFFTSPFERAAIIVCDRHSAPEVSVWLGEGATITDQCWGWEGPGFASSYSGALEPFGLRPGEEHLLEALARAGVRDDGMSIAGLLGDGGGSLGLRRDWQARLELFLAARTCAERRAAAGAFQRTLRAPLLALLADVRRRLDVTKVCLGGGFFYNTYFNTAVQASGIFDQTFVPVNPGNAGLASGLALAGAYREQRREAAGPASPFLGPEFHPDHIKSTLDNCKLSYDYLRRSDDVLEAVVEALVRGQLVGWFQGRMEWGARALGHRSILANPLSQYVIDNLNTFLKQREPYRGYGVSICEEEAGRYFVGPAASPVMEYEYRPKDPELLRHVMPDGAGTLRVQTLDGSGSLFRDLHQAFRARTGVGMLVNTSFNGFREPIACTPRDAVRIFYGTGLDLLVMDRFVISK